MASVSFRGLTKVFIPPVPVLNDVSLEVRAGEFVAILGPSGCGKSTVLRCLAGLEVPTAGDLFIGERRVNDLAPAQRDVAMVFQNYALYPHLTVGENLEFPLRMRRVPPAERGRRVAAVAQRLGVGELLGRLPGALSGGQRQRVALGRALVREPAVFLFDEPLSNLDAGLRVQLRAELMALHRALGATMLYVTHDQAEALTMGDRIVVLHQGRIQQIGSPADVYGAPATTFVARFVGTPGMNLLEGGVVNGDAGPRAFLPLGFSSPLAVPPTLAAVPVLAGLRPEHLALTDPDRGAANARVEVIERLGSETLLHLSLSTGARITVRVPGLDPHHPGDLVGLLTEVSRVHWFDAGGSRLVPERRA